MPRAFDIDVGVAGTVTGLHYIPDDPGDRRTTIILAHGAGAPQLSPFMAGMAGGLASRGLDAVTFNFVYMDRGRRAPDPKARLELCYQAAIDTTRRLVPSARERIVVGGNRWAGASPLRSSRRVATRWASPAWYRWDTRSTRQVDPSGGAMRTSRPLMFRCCSFKAAVTHSAVRPN